MKITRQYTKAGLGLFFVIESKTLTQILRGHVGWALNLRVARGPLYEWTEPTITRSENSYTRE